MKNLSATLTESSLTTLCESILSGSDNIVSTATDNVKGWGPLNGAFRSMLDLYSAFVEFFDGNSVKITKISNTDKTLHHPFSKDGVIVRKHFTVYIKPTLRLVVAEFGKVIILQIIQKDYKGRWHPHNMTPHSVGRSAGDSAYQYNQGFITWLYSLRDAKWINYNYLIETFEKIAMAR